VIERLSPSNHAVAVRIAGLPESIRGYGRVKEAAAAEAAKARVSALEEFAGPKAHMELAA
jgi:indolepyruvate ferredoxin oxidoreductase